MFNEEPVSQDLLGGDGFQMTQGEELLRRNSMAETRPQNGLVVAITFGEGFPVEEIVHNLDISRNPLLIGYSILEYLNDDLRRDGKRIHSDEYDGLRTVEAWRPFVEATNNIYLRKSVFETIDLPGIEANDKYEEEVLERLLEIADPDERVPTNRTDSTRRRSMQAQRTIEGQLERFIDTIVSNDLFSQYRQRINERVSIEDLPPIQRELVQREQFPDVENPDNVLRKAVPEPADAMSIRQFLEAELPIHVYDQLPANALAAEPQMFWNVIKKTLAKWEARARMGELPIPTENATHELVGKWTTSVLLVMESMGWVLVDERRPERVLTGCLPAIHFLFHPALVTHWLLPTLTPDVSFPLLVFSSDEDRTGFVMVDESTNQKRAFAEEFWTRRECEMYGSDSSYWDEKYSELYRSERTWMSRDERDWLFTEMAQRVYETLIRMERLFATDPEGIRCIHCAMMHSSANDSPPLRWAARNNVFSTAFPVEGIVDRYSEWVERSAERTRENHAFL